MNMYGIMLSTILYYGFIFIPLGIFSAALINKIQQPAVIRNLIIYGIILLASFFLEIILVTVSGRAVRIENLVISIIFITGSNIVSSLFIRRQTV